MSIYLCAECDNYRDCDYNPCDEINDELVCDECVLEIEEDNESSSEGQGR